MSNATKHVPQTESVDAEARRAASGPRPRRRRSRLNEEQRALAARYMALARRVARPYKRAWPSHWEEFESASLLAVVEAAESFDRSRGVRFATYAYHRIRGAMRDVQRELLARSRPMDFDSDFPIGSGDRFAQAGRVGRVIGVEADPPVGSELEGLDQIDRWLRRLPSRWAEVCRLIYMHGKTQTEAARELGMSQSRLCCIHRASLEMLQHDWAPQLQSQNRTRNAA